MPTRIINLTTATILLYPSSYSDIKIPVRKADEQRFLNRCIVLKPEGNANCQLVRESDTIEFTNAGSSKHKTANISTIYSGVVEGLPEQNDDTIYIVSQLLFNSIHHSRKDIYMIDKPVRNEAGLIIACRGFSRCVYDVDNSLLNGTLNYLQKKLSTCSDTAEAREIMTCVVALNKFKEK